MVYRRQRNVIKKYESGDKMINKLSIIAEVLCPKINMFSDINFCADCCYYKDIENGNIVLCEYNECNIRTSQKRG